MNKFSYEYRRRMWRYAYSDLKTGKPYVKVSDVSEEDFEAIDESMQGAAIRLNMAFSSLGRHIAKAGISFKQACDNLTSSKNKGE